MGSDTKPHSADYFGEYRDFWWNPDHLRLLASHWGVAASARVLDVGAGVGHWSAVLAEALPPRVKFVGVDAEPRWVAEAGRLLPGPRFSFRLGDATALPFAEETFDVVTCQTVLIHVSRPEVALGEMLRVLRPGGLLLAVEPSNRGGFFTHDTVTVGLSLDDQMRRARFYLTCDEGKKRLGEGDDSFGDLLPGALGRAGVEGVTVRLSDKALPMVPPYSSSEQQAMARQTAEWEDRGVWVWDRADTERYFRAGGGRVEEFEGDWAFVRGLQRAEREATAAEEFSTAGGALMYLVWGRKPGG